MKRIRIILLVLCCAPTSLSAQLLNIIGSPNDTIPCNQPCTTVSANYVKPNRTTIYQATSIAYNPTILSSATNLNLADDKFSGAVPIGFPFCFYDNQYTQVYISANGHITFNNNYSLGNCSFDTKQTIPFYNATFPDNAIFCPFNDGNTSIGGTIRYQTVGFAPFRKFIVQYSNIPFFGSACNGSPATFQCVLFETTNEIEIHIANKSTCNADQTNWLNYATMGIQNSAASNFLIINNRNASIWTASNESWRISPAGPPAYTLKWFNMGMNVAVNIPSISVCNPFPRTVTAELTLHCPQRVIIDTITIYKVSPKIDSVITTPSLCKNTSTGTATIFASGGTPPYTYSVNGSPYGSNNVFGGLKPGNNYAQVQDATGCLTTYSFIIGVASNLAAVIDSLKQPYCPNLNGAIYGSGSGGVPPYTYLWSTNATTPSINNIGPGSYTFKVTDAQGCTDSVTVLLQWDPFSLPSVTDSIIKPVCGDSTGSIYLSVKNGTNPYTYAWSIGSNNASVHNLPAGNYSVNVSDVNGCSVYHTVNLPDTLNLQINAIVVSHTSCGLPNGVGNLQITAAGLPPYTFLWSNTINTALTNTLSSGWQSVTVTDANNCSRTDSVNINPSIPLSLQFLPASAYCDEDNGLINTIVTGNTGVVSYNWNTGDTTSTIDSLPAGNYVLTITDLLGCSLTDSVSIINKGKPRLQVIKYDKPLCYGDSTGRLELGGNNGVPPYKYSLDGVNFSAVAVLTNFAAGTYTIYMRDANSCESDTTITFDPPVAIDITISGVDTLACFDDISGPLSFQATKGKAPYQWSLNGLSYQAQNTFSVLTIGTHTIFVIDANNCKNSKSILIPGPAMPLEIRRNITPVPCYQENQGVINAMIRGGWVPYTYTWSHTTSKNLYQNLLSAGSYQLAVTDAKGCAIDSSIEVPQEFCCDCYFPNAFTPNGDQNNDLFRAISPAADIESYRLTIFNRWGNRIFHTNELNAGWDGTVNGNPAPIGTYFYQAILKCKNKRNDVFLKGDIILIR